MSILNNQTFKSILFLLFFIGFNSFSQVKTKKHRIQKGETITSIAKDNDVSIKEIYDLNLNANKILKLNSVLLIPILNDKSSGPRLILCNFIIYDGTYMINTKAFC